MHCISSKTRMATLSSFEEKTGEPKSSRPVQVTFKHRDFRDPHQVTLKTDPAGRIHLGPLTGITSAVPPEGTPHSWNLLPDQHTFPGTIQGKVGESITLPFLPLSSALLQVAANPNSVKSTEPILVKQTSPPASDSIPSLKSESFAGGCGDVLCGRSRRTCETQKWIVIAGEPSRGRLCPNSNSNQLQIRVRVTNGPKPGWLCSGAVPSVGKLLLFKSLQFRVTTKVYQSNL